VGTQSVGLPKLIALELVAVAVIAAIALGAGIGSAGIASGYVDPLLHAGAQDEAVYGHAAAVMVRTSHWMTPVFLERFMLNKPPLLMWAGAASMRLMGISPIALRVPVLAAAVLCCVLIYWWVRRSRSIAAGLASVALLLGMPVFFSISRKFMTDALLTLFVVAAMFVIAVDPRWERRGSPALFGVLSGAGIMTKSAAGLLPLLILAIYWIFARSNERPPLRKVFVALAAAILVAAPWHVYQFVLHRDWFMAEYVRFQLLGSGVTAPSRYTGDTNLWFYAKTLWLTDPILVLIWATSVPWIVMAWKRASEARLLAAWFLTVAASLLVFGTRAAYYLLPLLPAMALASVCFSPLFRGWAAWVTCAALIVAFCLTADYKARSVPGAAALVDYAEHEPTNELLIVSPDDEFYASVINLPKVRYVYVSPLDPTKTSEFFYRLGMIVSGDEFCALPRLMPVYEQRLHAWKLPEDLHPEATLIDSGSVSKLAELIRCSPDRDFMIPEQLRHIAVDAGDKTHVAGPLIDGKFILFAKARKPKTRVTVAPGALVPISIQ